MFNLFLTDLVTYGLSSNIVVNSGVGVLLFGREKRYRLFRYISTLFLMLGIAICSISSYFLETYVYSKFDIMEIKVGVIVVIAALYNLLISLVWKKSAFNHYLYDCSCSYVFDLVFMVFVAMTLNYSVAIVPFILSVVAVMLVVFITNFFIGFYVEGINKSTLKIGFRNVSARLFLVAIFGVLLYYANMLV